MSALDAPLVSSDQKVPETLSPHQALVMGYMKARGSISTQVAMIELGVGSLSSRIAELRALGVKITDEWGTDHHGAKYKRYKLSGQEAT